MIALTGVLVCDELNIGPCKSLDFLSSAFNGAAEDPFPGPGNQSNRTKALTDPPWNSSAWV